MHKLPPEVAAMLPQPGDPLAHREFTETAGTPVRFTIGIDLGQSRDFSAAVIVEKIEAERTEHGPNNWMAADVIGPLSRKKIVRHHAVHLHRWPLGTSYPDIARSVAKIMSQLEPRPFAPELVVDATGVGRPVVDQMREIGLNPRAVTITGGIAASGSLRDMRVAKKLLASTLDAVMSSGRLKVAASDPLAETLLAELRNFTVRVTAAGNETVSSWRENEHDDLVLALALAVYCAESKGGTATVGRLPY